MKIHFKIILFLLIAALSSTLIYSCKSGNPVTPVQQDTATNFKYPLTENSNWFHTTRDFVFNIRPDSIKHYFSADTTIENGFSIVKNDTVINGITYKIFKTDHSSIVHAYTSLEYFRQTDSGLVSSSAYSKGTGFGPFIAAGMHISYSGKRFNNNRALLNYALGELSENYGSEPEFKCIQYPIVSNALWFFRKIDEVTDQYKKYISYENVTTPAGTFNCIKIQRQNLFGGINDENAILFDYFSKVGMMKRDYLIKNVEYTNTSGQVIGYFDIKDEVILNSYFIQN